MNDEIAPRLTAEERRESILAAACAVFGERGYAGATTDAIASVAGISQAYVVRTFGSKEQLFIAASNRATDRIAHTFRVAIAEAKHAGDEEHMVNRLGTAYVQLMADRGTLLTLLHMFTQGHHPVLGPIARERFLEVYRIVRDEAGLGGDAATVFFANGMLSNTLLALRLPDIAADSADARDLLECTFHAASDTVIQLSEGQRPLGAASR